MEKKNKLIDQITTSIKLGWLICKSKPSTKFTTSMEEKIALYCLSLYASKFIKKPIVEIGSYKGYSTLFIAKGVKHSGRKNKVFSIDPHYGTRPSFQKTITEGQVKKIVFSIKDKSQHAIKKFNKRISMLFIDGSHEYEDVREDFLSWSPLIVKGGFLLFHDIYSPDVKKAIDLHAKKHKSFKLIYKIQRLSVFEKIK